MGDFGGFIVFCLSGFLLMYRAGNERTVFTIKDSVQFAKDKLKKIYPLHIITMVIVIAYNVAEIIYWKNPLLTFGRFIIPGAVLNITLLQCWIPDDRVNIILNPVSWYLSTAAFLYFIFPYVCKYVRAKSYKKSITVCGLILLGEIFLCALFISVFGTNNHGYGWFMYYFPVFRIGDLMAGVILGRMCKENYFHERNANYYTLLEILTIAAYILFITWNKNVQVNNALLQATKNRTTLYVPIAAMSVYLFYKRKGAITSFLCNEILEKLGNISSATFLIHYPVIYWISLFILAFNIQFEGMRIIIPVLEFIITVFVSKIVCSKKYVNRH